MQIHSTSNWDYSFGSLSMVVGTYGGTLSKNKSNCYLRAHLQVRNIAFVPEKKVDWQADDERVLKVCHNPCGGLRAISPLRFLRWLLWSFARGCAWLVSVVASLLSRKARIARMTKYCYVGGCEDHHVDIEGAHNHDPHVSRYRLFEVSDEFVPSVMRATISKHVAFAYRGVVLAFDVC